MANNEDRQLGRAKNAILSFLEQRLSIPKIYIDAIWAGRHVDVLAINRDGVGDVYAVLLFPRRYFPDGMLNIVDEAQAIQTHIEQFESVPANYKYIAAVDTDSLRNPATFVVSEVLLDRTFSADGIGRIGFLTIAARLDEEPEVRVQVKAERFRATVSKIANEYVEQHEADWEIRA